VIDRFLHHGSLYDHTHAGYGPFYFLYTGVIYRVLGTSPTLFNGRLIVALVTMLSVIGFAAAAWKVTRSITMGVLCEVSAFVILITVAGEQPMHPGSLIVLLLSVMAYCFAAYAMERRTGYLVVIGGATGALLMTKVNIGLFAAAAIVIAYVSGNPRFARWLRVVVTVGALAVPFAITFQLLANSETAQFAVLMSFTLLMILFALQADGIALPPRDLWTTAAAAGVAVVISCIWPLATGTSPAQLFFGIVIQPLGQTDHLTITFESNIQWVTILLVVIGAYLITARRRGLITASVPPALVDGSLAVAGGAVLGLALFGGIAAWMPAIALLPMLTFLADVPRKVRVALRFLVPFAVLQMLHAYPVAGSQLFWGLVAVSVPCVIALAAGLRRLALWRATEARARVAVVAALCMMIFATTAIWPVTAWNKNLKSDALDLRGAQLVRVDARTKHRLSELTHVVQKHCDTFYSAPGLDSLYVFTGLPTPTGMLANWPGVLNDREQRELAKQLADLDVSERVCIVRNVRGFPSWRESSYGRGPLGRAIAPYQRQVGHLDNYTVSLLGPPNRQ
jgi:hypothetical protein